MRAFSIQFPYSIIRALTICEQTLITSLITWLHWAGRYWNLL